MKIDLVRIWATPSTLHLRLVWGPDSGAWIRSSELHVPWSDLGSETRRRLVEGISGPVLQEPDDEQLRLL